jgi:N-acetylmuramoyl-L-alanine amidase
MNQRRICQSILAGLALIAMLSGVVQGAPALKGVRHAVRENETRIVIDLSSRADYKVFEVEAPDRIAINLPSVRLSSSTTPLSISEGVVRRVRINRLSWGTQVVLDLRSRATWRDFHLSPVDNMPHRVVLDVKPLSRSFTTSTTQRAAVKTAQKSSGLFVVAIDAGHGGSDPGAMGRKGTVEKHQALEIARRLAKVINQRKGYKAVLTRDRDVFLSLPSRAEIARKKGADIFVSVHLNSAPSKSARGAEVFFLSPSGAQSTANKLLSNKKTAARELGLEGSSSEDILHMLLDVNQQSMMERSSLLAEEILRAIDRKGLPPTRTVKQRSFVVLKSITMPSVMVETGFLTNSKDAAILKSSSGKDRIANAIANGVFSFLQKYPPTTAATSRMVVHKVRRGDTLWEISRKYKTSVGSIQESNQMGKSQVIHIGQELVIREGNGTY